MRYAALPLIDAQGWSLVCDFDGTITPFDVTDALLDAFAHPSWKDIEEEWLNGGITARECMELQVSLLRAPAKDIDAFLESVPVTQGFMGFVNLCRTQGLRLTVVSDGLDYAIRRVLACHGIQGIPVIANRLVRRSDVDYRLEFPYGADGCPSGVCKCSVAGSEPGNILLIGDGKSDCCLAESAAFVVARKGKELQRHCEARQRPHALFEDFVDVQSMVVDALGLPVPGARDLPLACTA